MKFFKRYSPIISLLTLTLIAIVLISPLDTILARQATFIGTELHHASENRTPVRIKMDLGDTQHMDTFPKRFGNWIGINHDSSQEAENLQADFLLLRTYLNTQFYQPIHFIIMQSDDTSSFHPPPICYRSTGWEIEEEGTVEIPVHDTQWADHGVVDSNGVLINPIVAKKMVAVKNPSNSQQESEQELVLYFYVKGRVFEDKITIVEVTVKTTPEQPYDEQLSIAANFMGETIPFMFEPAQEDDRLIKYLSNSWAGIALIIGLIMIPAGIVIYPRIRKEPLNENQ